MERFTKKIPWMKIIIKKVERKKIELKQKIDEKKKNNNVNEKLQSYYTRQLIYKDTFNSILGPEIVLFELSSNNFFL